MEEKSELGDIILNKDSKEGGSKKIILAAAALGVILIVVVLLMNTLSQEPQNNLPQQATLPPKPAPQKAEITKEEPLFEDVEVVDEANSEDKDLEEIAKKLKAQSQEAPEPKEVQQEVAQKPKIVTDSIQKTPQHTVQASQTKSYYIQVGSFTKQPDKKFLTKIKQNGYSYKLYKTTVRGKRVTKVLIGPFGSRTAARAKLSEVRKRIIHDAFLARI